MFNVQIGEAAPPFTCTAVVDGCLKEISLSAYTDASHWVAMFFFPKAWSPVCPTEIRAFSRRLDEFLYPRACAIVFVSTDSADCLRAWTITSEAEGGLGKISMPLISDCNHALSKAYGVLDEKQGISQRAFVLIDPSGIIRAINAHDGFIAQNVNEVLRLLDALIFKDENGEGCAADWKKGDSGVDMKMARTEGVYEIPKKVSSWLRPKLVRAVSAASTSAFSARAQDITSAATDMGLRSAPPNGSFGLPPPSPSSSFNSPAMSPGLVTPSGSGGPKGSYFTSHARSSPSRSEVHIDEAVMQQQREEAILQQRMENMNAALGNHRFSGVLAQN